MQPAQTPALPLPPGAGEPRVGVGGGQEDFSAFRRVLPHCRRQDFAPPWRAACRVRCCCNSPPTAGRAGFPGCAEQHSETGAWGERGMSPGFCRVAGKCSSPPDRVSSHDQECFSRGSLGWAALSSGVIHGVRMSGLGQCSPGEKPRHFPEDKQVASGASVCWRWIFRATTFVQRFCSGARWLLVPLQTRLSGPLAPLLRARKVMAGLKSLRCPLYLPWGFLHS